MLKNTIWITGSNGRLGSSLVTLLKKNTDYKIIDTDIDVDITDNELVEKSIEIYRPNIIINCAALTDKEYCENHKVEAFKVNALGARNIAAASRLVNAKIIQFSTDDVFFGNTENKLTEFDVPNPNTVYGKSKLAGENYVKELNPKHLIIRSSWLYGHSDENYYTFVLNNAKNGTSFEAPTNVISAPTNAKSVAQLIIALLDKSEYGIYHASCEGSVSRYEYAKAILKANGYSEDLVKPVEAQQNYTVLENLMMKMTGLFEMPSWEEALEEYVNTTKEG